MCTWSRKQQKQVGFLRWDRQDNSAPWQGHRWRLLGKKEILAKHVTDAVTHIIVVLDQLRELVLTFSVSA